MKKLFALLLSVVTLLTVLPLTGAAVADDAPVVSVGSAEGYAGDEVRVPVNLSEHPPLTAFRFKIRYDSDILELTDVEFPTLFSSPATGGSLTANPYIISWFSTESADESAYGDFAYLTFRIKEGTPAGTTSLHIEYDPLDLCDSALRDVTLVTSDGSVDIRCEHQWDAFQIRCEKCGNRRMLGYSQQRTSADGLTKDFRIFVETAGEYFESADYILMTIDFQDESGNSLRSTPFVLKITTVFKRVWAGDAYYTPFTEGYYLSGAMVTGIPVSAGVKYITASATFVRGETSITYDLGRAQFD